MARRKLTRGILVRIGRRIRYIYLRLILLPDTPHRVGLGLAVGIFFGLLPIIPFQSAASIAFAWILRGSKVAAPIGALITNPITIPVFYAIDFYLGKLLTPFGNKGAQPSDLNIYNLSEVGLDWFLAALAGGFVLAIIFSPLTYWLIYKYVGRLQAWERRKLRERFDISSAIAD